MPAGVEEKSTRPSCKAAVLLWHRHIAYITQPEVMVIESGFQLSPLCHPTIHHILSNCPEALQWEGLWGDMTSMCAFQALNVLLKRILCANPFSS